MNNYSVDLPYINIPEINANFLIDTGSTKSFINPNLAYQKFQNFIKNELFQVKTAHAASYHNETIEIPLFPLFQTDLIHKFYLFDFSKKFDGLIGLDLLTQLNAQIDLNSFQLITPNTTIPICYTNKISHHDIVKNKFKEPYQILVPPRTQLITKIPVNTNQGIGVLNYIDFHKVEMPEALVNIENNFAITTLTNSSENPVKITLLEPLNIEPIDINEINFTEKMETDIELNEYCDDLQKSNLKNLRLEHCNQEEYDSIRKLCYEFRDIFHCDKIPLTFSNQIKHQIKLTNDSPTFTKSYRYPEIHRQEVQSQIQKMLDSNIIQNSNSPWSSPIWIVPKKLDASNKRKWRVVIDYRKLNEKTIDDKFPLPNIHDILDKLGKSQYFTTLDLANGFHQIEMHPDDVQKTAFSTDTGHFEFKRMPFGLKNAPSTFQRVMNNILRGLQNEICAVYLDDIIIFSTSLQEHIQRLREVFQRLRESNFKIQLDKSEFLRHEVAYLGHVITPQGCKPNPEKILAVKNFPIPKTPKEIKSFLGLAGYYRRFIKNFAKITKPLTTCLKKDEKVIHTPQFIESFEHLKTLLINAPILQYPDFTKPFVLTTDASNIALGAVLSQGVPPNDKPIAYASRTLNGAECRYSTIEKELLAIVWSCKYFRPYLFGRKFFIYTDHRPLVWLFNLKEPNSKLVRWRLKLEEFNYEIIYKKGKQNTNADALSRIQLNANETESLINNPGEANDDIINYLRELAEHPIDNPNMNNNPTDTPTINDTPNMQPESTDNTAHTSPETRNEGIPILNEIINNKHFQIILDRTPHEDIKVKQQKLDGYTVNHIKTPLNETSIIRILKEYVNPNGHTHIYFLNKDLIPLFTKTYIENFKPIKLFQCTEMVNHIIDQEEKILLIRNQHEGKTNHRGILETLNKLKLNYYWKNMKNDVTQYLNNCDVCQRTKYNRHPPEIPLLTTNTPSKPFQILHIDIFHFENQSFLTIMDKFSKLGQAYPCVKTAKSITDKLLQYFSCYGTPEAITSDRGTEFNNELVKEFLGMQKIKIHFTTPGHHESNSPVERFHSTLIEHLRILKEKDKTKPVTELIPYAIIAYNSSIHTITKMTPFELTFGHTNSRDPFDLIPTTFYTEYASAHKDKLDSLYKTIHDKMSQEKQNLIEKRNENIKTQHKFEINQKVFKKVEARNKKSNKFIGPYYIIELLSNNKAKIKNPKKKKFEIIHLKELKPVSVITDSGSPSIDRPTVSQHSTE